MNYNLDALATLCSERSLQFHRVADSELEITVTTDCVLAFQNLIIENDTMAGFKGTPWHFHNTLMLMTSESTCIELNEREIVQGILSGEIVILSRYLSNKLEDRWLAHKAKKLMLDTLHRVKRCIWSAYFKEYKSCFASFA